jgi:hypothetical protein
MRANLWGRGRGDMIPGGSGRQANLWGRGRGDMIPGGADMRANLWGRDRGALKLGGEATDGGDRGEDGTCVMGW